MKRSLVILLLAATALAGCTSDDDGGNNPDNMEGEGEEEIFQLEAPVWTVGDYWTYDTSFGGQWSLVVSEDTGSDWILDTDDATMAFIHNAFDELGYLGPIDKETLAGTEGSSSLDYFDWPLENGKTWTATMDGESFDMVAHMISERKFHIQAMQEDIIVNQYQYDANVGWFEWFSWGDAEGNEQFRIELSSSGNDWTGELLRVDATLLDQQSWSGPTPPSLTLYNEPDSVEDGDIFLQYQSSCTDGTFSFGIGTVESLVTSSGAPLDQLVGPTSGPLGGPTFTDQGFSEFGAQCPSSTAIFGIISVDLQSHDHWGMTYSAASQDAEVAFTAHLMEYERITL